MAVHAPAEADKDRGVPAGGPARPTGHAVHVDPAHPALVDAGADRSPPGTSERSNGWDRASDGRPSGSSGALHATRSATPDRRGPTVVETGEELILFVDMIVIGATIMPGFLLCVPALALIIVPAVAIGLAAAAVGLAILLVAAPVRLGWRAARRLRHALAARRVPEALTVPPPS